MNHAPQTLNAAFFSFKSRTFGFGLTNSGAFDVLSAKLSAPILVQWVPCPWFSLFLQKPKHLYPHPNYYLGLGFEFGPQRIRNLAFVWFEPQNSLTESSSRCLLMFLHSNLGMRVLWPVLLQVPKYFGLIQIFCVRPIDYSTYCASPKLFVPDQMMISI